MVVGRAVGNGIVAVGTGVRSVTEPAQALTVTVKLRHAAMISVVGWEIATAALYWLLAWIGPACTANCSKDARIANKYGTQTLHLLCLPTTADCVRVYAVTSGPIRHSFTVGTIGKCEELTTNDYAG